MKIELSERQLKLIVSSLPDSREGRKLRAGLEEYMNPIKDGRIVSDITFATRLRSFLDGVTVSDAVSDEELEYLKLVAGRLLRYQRNTVTDEAEKAYFKNLMR